MKHLWTLLFRPHDILLELKQDAADQTSTTTRQVSKLGLFSFMGLAIVSFQVGWLSSLPTHYCYLAENVPIGSSIDF